MPRTAGEITALRSSLKIAPPEARAGPTAAGRARDCGNREQRDARRPKPTFIVPLPYWSTISNDDMEAAMKTLAARMALATSLALTTLATAETAYAQDYQSNCSSSNTFS